MTNDDTLINDWYALLASCNDDDPCFAHSMTGAVKCSELEARWMKAYPNAKDVPRIVEDRRERPPGSDRWILVWPSE